MHGTDQHAATKKEEEDDDGLVWLWVVLALLALAVLAVPAWWQFPRSGTPTPAAKERSTASDAKPRPRVSARVG